jgi:hypothetical protein
MGYKVQTAALTSAQTNEAIELIQKIESINAAINELQLLRRDAQAAYLLQFKDEYTPKEAALAEERNKCVDALRAIRQIKISEV